MSDRILNSLTDGVPPEIEIEVYEARLQRTDLNPTDRALLEKALAEARAELKNQTEQS